MKQEKDKKRNGKAIQEIYKKIEELSLAYTPEWKFNQKDPDIGSVIALIFSKQIEENRNYFNMVLEEYYIAFINMLNISLLPAHPACVPVIFNLPKGMEVDLPKGIKLLGEKEGEDQPLIFETTQDIHATSARLTDMFMVSGDTGQINVVQEDMGFTLFDFSKKGIDNQVLLLYHSSVFDIEKEPIILKFSGDSMFSEKLAKKNFCLSYYTEEGVMPVEIIQLQGNQVIVQKEKNCKKIEKQGNMYSLFILENFVPAKEVRVENIEISSMGRASVPDIVSNGTTELEVGGFFLFGDILQLFSECYIGHASYFTKPDATLTICFQVEFKEHLFSGYLPAGYSANPQKQKADNLPLIKRKPKPGGEVFYGKAYVEEISVEYYNGIGWRRVLKEKAQIFAKAEAGNYKLSFVCPADWAVSEINGRQMPFLRIRLLKAENCYKQPCYHYVPFIKELSISYTYNKRMKRPERLEQIIGTKRIDITKEFLQGNGAVLFSKGEYQETALYLGFDKQFENGPISMWFDIKENKGIPLTYFYSSVNGFKPLKITDYTENMAYSGQILFMPPIDMASFLLEGKERYWIKIALKKQQEEKPYIRRIFLNMAEAWNVETLETKELIPSQIGPNMEISLGAIPSIKNILDARVWTETEGNIKEWEEVLDFSKSLPTDYHYRLDRLHNKLIFGDGIHVKIPLIEDSIYITIRLCNGEKGNIGAYHILDTTSNMPLIEKIYNPVPAFYGSDTETLQSALKRGSYILSGKKRLIARADYIREALVFSDKVDKAECIVGKDGKITIVLLMKDFEKGPYSFCKLKNNFKEHLLKNCEVTIDAKEIEIVEPTFVEVSVSAWISVDKDKLAVKKKVEEELVEYFTPIKNQKNNGWEIGSLPTLPQILIKISSVKGVNTVDHLVVTGRYKDFSGIHKADIGHMPYSGLFACKSGIHNITVGQKDGC